MMYEIALAAALPAVIVICSLRQVGGYHSIIVILRVCEILRAVVRYIA